MPPFVLKKMAAFSFFLSNEPGTAFLQLAIFLASPVTRKKYSNVPGGPIKKTLSLNQVCAY
jgi:hypothetical protein